MKTIKNMTLLGMLFLSGCLFIRDRTYEVQPDGTRRLIDERTAVDPSNPVGSLPYGPIAISIMTAGAAMYSEWRKRDIQKKYVSTVRGIESAGLDADQIETIREAHQLAGVEEKVKADLKTIRCEKTPPPAPGGGA